MLFFGMKEGGRLQVQIFVPDFENLENYSTKESKLRFCKPNESC
jgi:hypothetical protein